MKGSNHIQCVDGEWTDLPICVGNVSRSWTLRLESTLRFYWYNHVSGISEMHMCLWHFCRGRQYMRHCAGSCQWLCGVVCPSLSSWRVGRVRVHRNIWNDWTEISNVCEGNVDPASSVCGWEYTFRMAFNKTQDLYCKKLYLQLCFYFNLQIFFKMLGRKLQWIETSVVCCSIRVYRGKTGASTRILWIRSDINIVYLYMCETKFTYTYTYDQNFFLSVSFVPPSSLAFHSSQEVYFLKKLFKKHCLGPALTFQQIKEGFPCEANLWNM